MTVGSRSRAAKGALGRKCGWVVIASLLGVMAQPAIASGQSPSSKSLSYRTSSVSGTGIVKKIETKKITLNSKGLTEVSLEVTLARGHTALFLTQHRDEVLSSFTDGSKPCRIICRDFKKSTKVIIPEGLDRVAFSVLPVEEDEAGLALAIFDPYQWSVLVENFRTPFSSAQFEFCGDPDSWPLTREDRKWIKKMLTLKSAVSLFAIFSNDLPFFFDLAGAGIDVAAGKGVNVARNLVASYIVSDIWDEFLDMPSVGVSEALGAGLVIVSPKAWRDFEKRYVDTGIIDCDI